jgi:glucose-6-phosphate 1-dehydrogenase
MATAVRARPAVAPPAVDPQRRADAIDAPPPVHPYAKGTWGPQEADRLLAGHGRRHEPWVAS